MATTHLFVELLIIGLGAVLWLSLLAMAVLGFKVDDFRQLLETTALLAPLLGMTYVLGILVDRISDWIFDKIFKDTHFETAYQDLFAAEYIQASLEAAQAPAVDELGSSALPPESTSCDEELRAIAKKRAQNRYFNDRRTLVVEAPELWRFMEYGRSRLRICRGWVLNSIMLLGATFALTFRAPAFLDGETFVVLTLFWYFLALSSLASWSKLNGKEYKKIRRQAAWVRDHAEETKEQDVKVSGFLNIN